MASTALHESWGSNINAAFEIALESALESAHSFCSLLLACFRNALSETSLRVCGRTVPAVPA